MNAREKIRLMHEYWLAGHWNGETPDELLGRWRGCRHAEVLATGDLYIADPQRGHYLDDAAAHDFCEWLADNGVSLYGVEP